MLYYQSSKIGIDSILFVIDIANSRSAKRIINVYQSFNPQGNVNARMKFKYQLELIKHAMIESCVLIGDFNIDYTRIYDDNYGRIYQSDFII